MAGSAPVLVSLGKGKTILLQQAYLTVQILDAAGIKAVRAGAAPGDGLKTPKGQRLTPWNGPDRRSRIERPWVMARAWLYLGPALDRQVFCAAKSRCCKCRMMASQAKRSLATGSSGQRRSRRPQSPTFVPIASWGAGLAIVPSTAKGPPVSIVLPLFALRGRVLQCERDGRPIPGSLTWRRAVLTPHMPGKYSPRAAMSATWENCLLPVQFVRCFHGGLSDCWV